MASGGLGFDLKWDDFENQINRAVSVPTAEVNLPELAWSIARTYNGRAIRRVIYTESHDAVGHSVNQEVRVPLRIDPPIPPVWPRARSRRWARRC